MFGFELPVPASLQQDARRVDWTGAGFRVGDQLLPVLEYSENFAGWSDDLTHLHEHAVGSTHPIDLASRREACRALRRWVHAPQPVILEIGCSSGFLLQDLSHELPQARLIGADVVKQPLLQLARRMPQVPLLRFDLLLSPIPDGVLDAVVLLNVLEHIEDDGAALSAVFRMLKPGGHVVLEVPAGSWLYDDYDRGLQHFRRYDMPQFLDIVRQVGLQPVRATHLGFLLYPAFAAVKWMNQRRAAAAGGRDRQELVARQAERTSRSGLMHAALKAEDWLRERMRLPFGIRCLVVARKPS